MFQAKILIIEVKGILSIDLCGAGFYIGQFIAVFQNLWHFTCHWSLLCKLCPIPTAETEIFNSHSRNHIFHTNYIGAYWGIINGNIR